jgi:predicted permease
MPPHHVRLLQRIAKLLIRGPDAPDIRADLDEIFERDIARGLSVPSARRRYAINLLSSALSTWRGVPWLLPGGIWLDAKLGTRMLRKQPVLTVVAVLTLGLGIPLGVLPLHVVDSLTATLPVEDGDDVVRVWNWDRVDSREVRRPIHDLAQWRGELRSFEDLAIGRSDVFNVISEDGRAAPVRGAEVSASVFGLLRVPPELGRPLDESDEGVGAPDVVVIGHDLWQSRLAGDPDVVGSTIRVGAVPRTVVGVMPEGFLFPLRDHLWVPFQYDPLQYEYGQGPVAWIMGRLAEGVTIADARNELELVGQRMTADFPDTHATLQPQVLPYTEAHVPGIDRPEGLELLFIQILFLTLLALACGNVGILILARAATRTGEIAIRTALGASRGRIVSQIFVESLVLAIGAAGVGLLAGQLVAPHLGARWPLPYWASFDITGKTVIAALSLAVLSAAVAGIVPALKATGRNVQASIQRTAGGRSGIRFGAASHLMVVAQVTVAVLCLGFGSALVPTVINDVDGLGIDAGQYLSASLRIPRVEPPPSAADEYGAQWQGRVRDAHLELGRLLEAEPGVGPVAIASHLPGMSHPRRRVEVEGEPLAPGTRGHPVRTAYVDAGYFRALNQPILSGRDLSTADLAAGGASIIVNTSFVDRVLGGRQPLGQRIRYAVPSSAEPRPWYEIVGVVGHLGMDQLNPDLDQGVYHPASPGDLHPVRFAMRVGADPGSFAPRLRSLVAAIDPIAVIEAGGPLDEVVNYDKFLARSGILFMAVTSAITILLAAAGIYALMSFMVAERTREIGIRTALGAQRSSIVAAIARRAFAQLTVGVTIGAVLASLMLRDVKPGADVLQVTNWPVTVPIIAAGVLAVGMLACVSPTRRGLRVQPVEALRS